MGPTVLPECCIRPPKQDSGERPPPFTAAVNAKVAPVLDRNADPNTVGPDPSVREAARLIHEIGHNRLPVVEDGRLVGVVTRLDVLGALAA